MQCFQTVVEFSDLILIAAFGKQLSMIITGTSVVA